jgi:RimJ/RimL family protein N-acetyltransferase
MSFSFRRPTLDDAERILTWRTKPEITRHMFTDIAFDVERQRAWLKSCEDRRDYRHFVIEFAGEPLGLLSYAGIDWVSRHCMPGIYMDLPPQRRSIAGLVNTYIADYAFLGMGMNKIVYYIMATNTNFIEASRRLKSRELGVMRDHVFKDGRYHDVYLFEKTRAEWETDPRLFRKETTLASFPPEDLIAAPAS